MKRIQNIIAESGMALPVMGVLTLMVWTASELIMRQGLFLFFTFVATTCLIVEMNNRNALLRIRSRMVSCAFLALSCSASFLFGSVQAQVIGLCFTVVCSLLFMSYQDSSAVGKVFYAFLFLGGGSMAFAKIIYLVPVIWLLMAFQLQILSFRTFLASILGLITPYWLLFAALIISHDFSFYRSRLCQLVDFEFPSDYTQLSIGNMITYFFVISMLFVGIINFWNRSFEDKIKTRQIYGFFTVIGVYCALWLALQPQHYSALMPIIIICTSPLIAHYIALTSSRLTNIFFFIIVGLTIAITIFNLWTPSLNF